MAKIKYSTSKNHNNYILTYFSRGVIYLTINANGVKPLLPFDYSVFVKLKGRPDFGDAV